MSVGILPAEAPAAADQNTITPPWEALDPEVRAQQIDEAMRRIGALEVADLDPNAVIVALTATTAELRQVRKRGDAEAQAADVRNQASASNVTREAFVAFHTAPRAARVAATHARRATATAWRSEKATELADAIQLDGGSALQVWRYRQAARVAVWRASWAEKRAGQTEEKRLKVASGLQLAASRVVMVDRDVHEAEQIAGAAHSALTAAEDTLAQMRRPIEAVAEDASGLDNAAESPVMEAPETFNHFDLVASMEQVEATYTADQQAAHAHGVKAGGQTLGIEQELPHTMRQAEIRVFGVPLVRFGRMRLRKDHKAQNRANAVQHWQAVYAEFTEEEQAQLKLPRDADYLFEQAPIPEGYVHPTPVKDKMTRALEQIALPHADAWVNVFKKGLALLTGRAARRHLQDQHTEQAS